jgi:hypothetical protein
LHRWLGELHFGLQHLPRETSDEKRSQDIRGATVLPPEFIAGFVPARAKPLSKSDHYGAQALLVDEETMGW